MPDHRSRLSWVFRSFLFLFILWALALLWTGTRALGFSSEPGFSFLSAPGYLPLLLQGYPPPTPTPAPGKVLISEVLYQPDGSEPQGEWLELYNAGGLPVSLAGYKIGDEGTRGGLEGMFQFPPGAQIFPGQVIVIANRAIDFQEQYGFWPDYELQPSSYAAPDLVKYTAWASGGVNLSNSGDEVLLLDDNDHLVDALSWGASTAFLDPAVMLAPRGASLERYPAYRDRDIAEDWRTRLSPSPGKVETPPPTPTPSATTVSTPSGSTVYPPTQIFTQTPQPSLEATPALGRLLISEVLIDPFLNEPQGEWFELFNAGGSALDLSQYKVGDETSSGGLEGMYRFPPGAQLASGQVCIVAHEAQRFYEQYGFLPDYEISESRSETPNLLLYSTWAGGILNLNNLGDDLLILDGQDQVVDAVSWGSSTWAFNPSAPPPAEGKSLERCPSTNDTNQASDWREQALPNPGLAACLP